jgi:Tol biopolymer transport system component
MRQVIRFSFCILCILLVLIAGNAFPQSWKKGKVTFLSTDWNVLGGKSQCSIMNADGSDVTMLIDTPFRVGNQYIESGFTLSPDCKKAAVVMETRDDAGNELGSDIAVFDIDSHKLINLTNGQLEGCAYPRWSPDGRQIVFHSTGGKSEIYTINSDGTNIRVISEGRSPDWSYNGKKIAFIKDDRDICIMNVNGKNLENITNGQVVATYISPPRWSPDDRQILFHASFSDEDRIYVMNSDGSELKLIMKLLSSCIEGDACCWSPDGQKIAFPAEIEPETFIHIWVINPDGSNLERFTHNSNNLEEVRIDWRDPTFFGVSPLLKSTTTWGNIKQGDNANVKPEQ